MSLNSLRSLKVIRNDNLEKGVSRFYLFVVTMSVLAVLRLNATLIFSFIIIIIIIIIII